MNKLKLFALVGFIGLMGVEVFANQPSAVNELTTYKRTAGSTKFSKEFKIHSTHDNAVVRKYNTSVKANQYVEVKEQPKDNTTVTSKTRSVRSFNFNNGHQSIATDNQKEKTSPFRSIKWRK